MEAPVKREGRQSEVQPLSERDFIGRVEQRFNSAFEEVLGERKPTVIFTPFLSKHETEKDVEGLRAEILRSNIFFPEAFGFRPEDLNFLKACSFGAITEEDAKKAKIHYGNNSIFVITADKVHASGVIIDILDVPAGHKLEKESKRAWAFNVPYTKEEFPGGLTYVRKSLGRISTFIRKREEYILSQITAEKVRDLLDNNFSLQDKEEIRILMSLGMGHSGVPSDFPDLSFTNQGILKSLRGQEISDDFAAKILVERDIIRRRDLSIGFLTVPIGELSLETIEGLYNKVKQGMLVSSRS